MRSLFFFLHLSISGKVNNIKIICSIRFSLFITIDRFYKLFLAEGAFVNRRPEMISLPLFHTASPIQPPPLRGTSFHRKEGVSTRAPSLGRGCRAQRGGVGFLFCGARVLSYRSLPHWGRGTAPAVDRVLSLIVDLRCISSLSFIPLSPSNLRPFGAPPSIGRREYPHEPLPLEGAAERSEARLASFFAAKPPPLCLPH